MKPTEYEAIAEEAADIAEEASEIALSYFRQAVLIETKDDGSPVTIADKKTEQKIRASLEQSFPDHGILGEEYGSKESQSDFTWIIDPIDGTRSFIRGIPLFGTLLGLLEKGKPVVGIMVLPALDETYVGAQGMGTFCNGVQLHCSKNSSLESSFVSCADISGFESAGKMSYYEALVKKSEALRGYTDCFGHSLLMRGSVDAMVDPVVSLWDVAALACLVTEAGGQYFTFEGKEDVNATSFITCGPNLKDDLVGLAL